jgi:serine/threonine-protein kinase SRPK3
MGKSSTCESDKYSDKYSDIDSDIDSDNYSDNYSDIDSEEDYYKTNIDLHNDIIDKYNVISRLGSGTFSNVWLVYNINDGKYYALKVQNYDDYEAGLDEVNFLKKLKHHKHINNLIDYFIEKRFINENIEKFICSVYDICCLNVHDLLNMDKYKNGLPKNLALKIFKQICDGVEYLHNTVRVFHGDLKPENILICGINNRDKYYINKYNERNFVKVYKEVKNKYWVEKGNKLENIKNMAIDVKLKIRKQVHLSIMTSIDKTDIDKLDVDNKYIENICVKISDFGSYCSDNDIMKDTFGTQYYMAPEMIVMSDCRKAVDIWALGCILYELLTGELLFEPDGEDQYTTDLNHLKLLGEYYGDLDVRYLNSGSKYNNFFYKGRLKQKFKKTNDLSLKINNLNDKNIEKIIHNCIQLSYQKRINIFDLKQFLSGVCTNSI